MPPSGIRCDRVAEREAKKKKEPKKKK